MGKDQNIFLHHNSATTTDREISRAVTADTGLRHRVHLAVIDPMPGEGFTLSLYRESSKAPGLYSRDTYLWAQGKWESSGKDAAKYVSLPIPPVDAEEIQIGSVKVWTRRKLTYEQAEDTRRLVQPAKP